MSYSKTNWQDLPSLDTPVNATRLNKIENRGKKSAGVLRKLRRQINKYIARSSSPV